MTGRTANKRFRESLSKADRKALRKERKLALRTLLKEKKRQHFLLAPKTKRSLSAKAARQKSKP